MKRVSICFGLASPARPCWYNPTSLDDYNIALIVESTISFFAISGFTGPADFPLPSLLQYAAEPAGGRGNLARTNDGIEPEEIPEYDGSTAIEQG